MAKEFRDGTPLQGLLTPGQLGRRQARFRTFFELIHYKVTRRDKGTQAVVYELQRPPLSPAERALKRALDFALASTLLIALAPLFLFVGMLIKLESAGPVIFSQRRIGFNGRRSRSLNSGR